MLKRTIAVPVAEVIEGGTKQEFYSELRQCLNETRLMANVAMTECARQDETLFTTQEKFSPYVYPVLSKMAGSGMSHIAQPVYRSVEKSYKVKRYAVARGQVSLPCFRSFPIVLLRKQTDVQFNEQFVAVKLKLRKWWTVRIAGGSNYKDQIRGLRKALRIGDSKIWTDRRHVAVIGFLVELPKPTERNIAGVLNVVSARDALIVVTKDWSDTPFTINGDQVLKWLATREKQRQRLNQDRKSGGVRASIKKKQQEHSAKWDRVFKTFCHQLTSQVVQHAVRRNVAEIRIDFTIKSFCKSFPWFQVKTMLEYKSAEHGIRVVDASLAVADPDVSKPHVYFKYSPSLKKIKIGRTLREDGGRHGAETDSAEDLVILAVDNQPKNKVAAREKHHQAYFSHCRDLTRERVKEWFEAEPVLNWLREVGWLGNAGNLSQIAQFIEV